MEKKRDDNLNQSGGRLRVSTGSREVESTLTRSESVLGSSTSINSSLELNVKAGVLKTLITLAKKEDIVCQQQKQIKEMKSKLNSELLELDNINKSISVLDKCSNYFIVAESIKNETLNLDHTGTIEFISYVDKLIFVLENISLNFRLTNFAPINDEDQKEIISLLNKLKNLTIEEQIPQHQDICKHFINLIKEMKFLLKESKETSKGLLKEFLQLKEVMNSLIILTKK